MYPRVTRTALEVNARVHIPLGDIELRATTSGGPGGQHANRTLSRVIARFDVAHSALSPTLRDRLVEAKGAVIESSASRHRSQAQNRQAALEQLGVKIASGLSRPAERRASRPTLASQRRRVDQKKARGETKSQRRFRPSDAD